MPGLRLARINGLNVAILRDSITLKLKKLSTELRSRNIPTAQIEAFDRQQPLIGSSVGVIT